MIKTIVRAYRSPPPLALKTQATIHSNASIVTRRFPRLRMTSSASTTATTSSKPPSISHVLETCLYVKSMEESAKFYKNVLGLEPEVESSRITVFPLGNSSTLLLLFQLGATTDDLHPTNGGLIPNHGPSSAILDLLLQPTSDGQKGEAAAAAPSLKQHFCLAVQTREEVERWEEHLQMVKAEILGTMDWERGGRSVYFRDPDGHVGEVGSRGIWAVY